MSKETGTILNNRLNNQLITQNRFSLPGELISHMGAIQAQDYNGAKWSIGLRLTGTTNDSIEYAIAEKTIVRTWLMRGTLFFVNAKDLRWVLNLVAPKIIQSSKRRNEELKLDLQTLIQCTSIIEKILHNKKELSRPELLTEIQNKGISTEGQRAAHILQYTALQGIICQTNTIKNIPNYILTDNLVTKHNELTKEEAISELAKRYFISRGPATTDDFAWWSGLTKREAKQGLEAVKSNFFSEVINEHTYWFKPNTVIEPPKTNNIYLMPGFDEFLLGYKNREASLDKKHYSHWCPGNNGMFIPFIVRNGKVIGTWKRKNSKISLQYLNNKTSFSQIQQKSALKQLSEYLAIPLKLE